MKMLKDQTLIKTAPNNNDTTRGFSNTVRETLFGLRLDFLVCLFLGLITFVAYWQVMNHEFVYDDVLYITKNYQVQKGITLENIYWSLTANVASNWHPLTMLSHMLDCQLHGLAAGRHHLTSLLFHVANTLLLFLVLKRMTKALWQSAVVAALFAIHPLHVESVAWVSERKDVLSTFFWLSTMWSYIWYTESPGFKRYFPVLFFLVLGLMSKPMLVTLPFVLLLIDYWPLKRFQFDRPGLWRLVLEKTPLFAVVAASCIITFHYQQTGGSVATFDKLPVFLRLTNAISSYINYIINMFWPFELAAFYPYFEGKPVWKIMWACLMLLSITFFSIKTIKQHAYISVGWFWYLGTLVPVIGLVQVGAQSMADRYTYVPLTGIFIIIAWGIPQLVSHWQHRKAGLVIIFTSLILILTAATGLQVRYWKDTMTLFGHAIHATSQNYFAHSNLGVALEIEGKLSEAAAHFSKALQINPRYVNAHTGMGIILDKQGKTTEAIRYFSEALQINPQYAEAHCNMGIALTNLSKTTEAIRHFSKALQINPQFVEAHNNMGIALEKQGKINEAIRHFSEALQIDPEDAKVHYHLGTLLEKDGKTDEAIRHFSEALRINPQYKEGHNNLGVALAKQGEMTAAIKHFSEALRIDPQYAEAHRNMGISLEMQGNINEAIRHFSEALRINTEDAHGHYHLGTLFEKNGETKEALKHYHSALEINPEYALAHYNLGCILANQKKFSEAFKHFSDALRIDPDFAPAHNNLGNLLAFQGRISEAVTHYSEVLRLDPNSYDGYYNLACLYATQNRIEESIDYLKKAIDKGFDDWDLLKTDKDLENIRNTSDYMQLMSLN